MAMEWARETFGLGRGRMRPALSNVGLLGLCVGSIVGTGWVQATTAGPQMAGTAVLISWTLGAACMLFLALVLAELGRWLPAAGGGARYPRCAFGRTAGFVSAWVYWCGVVSVPPVEAIVAVESLGTLVPLPLVAGSPVALTGLGRAVAAVLLALFAIVNAAGIRWLVRVNAVATVFKVAVPLVMVIVLGLLVSRPASAGPLLPQGMNGVQPVFLAVASGGIIFALLGFDNAVQFGEEVRNPDPGMPWAIKGSLYLGVAFYLLIQVAFLFAGIHAGKDSGSSPFVAVVSQAQSGGLPLVFVAMMAVVGVVSPASTSLVFMGTSARLAYGAARSDVVPAWFAELGPQGVPLLAIVVALGVGLVCLIPAPGWEPLVEFSSAASVLGLAQLPLSLAVFRRTKGFRDPALRMPRDWRDWRARAALDGVPLAAFVVANLIVLFQTWEANRVLLGLAAGGAALFLARHLRTPRATRPPLDLRAAIGLPFYLAAVGLISWLSSFPGMHTHAGPLRFGEDVLVMTVMSVVAYFAAVRLWRLDPHETERGVRSLQRAGDSRAAAGP